MCDILPVLRCGPPLRSFSSNVPLSEAAVHPSYNFRTYAPGLPSANGLECFHRSLVYPSKWPCTSSSGIEHERRRNTEGPHLCWEHPRQSNALIFCMQHLPDKDDGTEVPTRGFVDRVLATPNAGRTPERSQWVRGHFPWLKDFSAYGGDREGVASIGCGIDTHPAYPLVPSTSCTSVLPCIFYVERFFHIRSLCWPFSQWM